MDAGSPVYVTDFPAPAISSETTTGQTASSSFTSVLAGGTPCEVTFVGPTSGRVLIINTAQLDNTSGTSILGWRLGTGSTIGGGDTILAPSEIRSLKAEGTNLMLASHVYPVTGLTPGLTYNVQQRFNSTSGTATFSRKHLIVIPLP